MHLFPLFQAASDPKEILGTPFRDLEANRSQNLLEDGALSNDELLHVMQKSVALKPFRQKVQQKYSAVLIDEFQDTILCSGRFLTDCLYGKGALKRCISLAIQNNRFIDSAKQICTLT